jgi:hypothetical protein
MFSGGQMLANGRFPTISRVRADAAAAFACQIHPSSSSGRLMARGSSSSEICVELSSGCVGDDGGLSKFGGLGNQLSIFPEQK